MLRFLLIGILFLCWSLESLLALERRRDPFDYDFSWYFYPIIQDIPGLGQVEGIGVNLVDIANTDLDFGGFKVDGEFHARGAYFLNQHLIDEELVLDLGFFDYEVASVLYPRGIDSDPNTFFLPLVKGGGYQGQLTWMAADRMLEAFIRQRRETYQVIKVFDHNGMDFFNIDNQEFDYILTDEGIRLDWTDDRQDPRKGIRYEWLKKTPQNSDPLVSDFHVIDQNLSVFIPFGKFSTWAFNSYRSKAVVTGMAETDVTTLKGLMSLNCSSYVNPLEKAYCFATEEQRAIDRSLLNQFGRATPLGGTQRLRAFPNGRFQAGQVRFFGTEFRWNLNQENTAFNWWIMKGVRTNLQLAFFYEEGTVADQEEELKDNLRHSTGLGFRIVFEGVTIRADWATGEEGAQTQIFIDYPWGLSAIDNSTR